MSYSHRWRALAHLGLAATAALTAGCQEKVVKVYVENGQPVQYGERLFAIKTK